MKLCFAAPNNAKLEPHSYYTLFIRVYVTDNLYTTTGWYPAVLTSPDKEPTLGDQKNEMGKFNQSF